MLLVSRLCRKIDNYLHVKIPYPIKKQTDKLPNSNCNERVVLTDAWEREKYNINPRNI